MRIRKQGRHEWFQEIPVECDLPFNADECARGECGDYVCLPLSCSHTRSLTAHISPLHIAGAAQTLGRWEGEKSLEASVRVCRHTTLAAGGSVEHDTLATATVHFAPLFGAGARSNEWTPVVAPLRLQRGVGSAGGAEARGGRGQSGGSIALEVRFKPSLDRTAPSALVGDAAIVEPVRWMRIRLDLISGTDLAQVNAAGAQGSGALALFVRVFAADGVTELPLCSETARGAANPRWDSTIGLLQVRSRSDTVELHVFNDVARHPVLLGTAQLALGDSVWGLHRSESTLKVTPVSFVGNALGRAGYLRLRLTVASVARSSSKSDAAEGATLPGSPTRRRGGGSSSFGGATKRGGGAVGPPSRATLSDADWVSLAARLGNVLRATEHGGLDAAALYRQYSHGGAAARHVVAERAFVAATKVLLHFEQGMVTEAQVRELARRAPAAAGGVDTRRVLQLLGSSAGGGEGRSSPRRTLRDGAARSSSPFRLTAARTLAAPAALEPRSLTRVRLTVHHISALRPPRDPSSTLVVALRLDSGELVEHSTAARSGAANAPHARAINRTFGFSAAAPSTVAVELAWRDLYGRATRIGVAQVRVFQELNSGARAVLVAAAGGSGGTFGRSTRGGGDMRISLSLAAPTAAPSKSGGHLGDDGDGESADAETLRAVLAKVVECVAPANLWAAFGARDAYATGVVARDAFVEVVGGMLPHAVVDLRTLERVAASFAASSGGADVDFVEFCAAVTRSGAEASGAVSYAPRAEWTVDGQIGGGGGHLAAALNALRRWAADHHHTASTVAATLLQGSGAISVPRARLRRRLESLGVRLAPPCWEALFSAYRALGAGAHGVDAERLALDAAPHPATSNAGASKTGRRGGARAPVAEADAEQRSTAARWHLLNHFFGDDSGGLGWREALDDVAEAFEGARSPNCALVRSCVRASFRAEK